MIKREVKRQVERYGKYLDIFLSFVFVALIVIPVISIINLSPVQSPDLVNTKSKNVLGVDTYTGDEIQLRLLGGDHNYIQNEELYNHSDLSFLYSTHVLIRDAGIYSKPIIQLNVPKGETLKVTFSIGLVSKSTTQIGITYEKVNYVLRDENGQQYIRSISFTEPGSYRLSLDLRNDSNVNFPEDIDIHIKVSPLDDSVE